MSDRLPEAPGLDRIDETARRIAPYVVETPTVRWAAPVLEPRLPEGAEVHLKLELLQVTGTFKPRGALSVMLSLDDDALARGVTCVSAGNHAIATAFAAKTLGTTAKIVMPRSANAFRIARARALGATVNLVDDVHQAFDEVQRIEREEGRTFVHPFDGEATCLGTATVGVEVARQIPELDAVVVPIGGGGLAAGVGRGVQLVQPGCQVFGVEPVGADSMRRSLDAGRPEKIDAVRTIADSLGAPYAAEYSFRWCQAHLDDVVLVDDDALRDAMGVLFYEAKLAVEPAGAATCAALLGPLRERLRGKRVALIICGANTDLETFSTQAGAS